MRATSKRTAPDTRHGRLQLTLKDACCVASTSAQCGAKCPDGGDGDDNGHGDANDGGDGDNGRNDANGGDGGDNDGGRCCCIAGVGSCPKSPRPPVPIPPITAAPTEIAVPPLWFPGGFTVQLSDGLRWEMAPGRRNVVAVWLKDPTAPPATASVVITAK